MKIGAIGEKISNMGKSTRDKQNAINSGEAYHLWSTLVSRYDALNITNILLEFTKDIDLKKIINDGIKVLNHEIFVLENLMKEFGVPMPDRPPEQANVAVDVNAITDKTVYRTIFDGIKEALCFYNRFFSEAPSSHIRENFRHFHSEEMDLFDKYIEYGKLKGYLNEAPTFRH